MHLTLLQIFDINLHFIFHHFSSIKKKYVNDNFKHKKGKILIIRL